MPSLICGARHPDHPATCARPPHGTSEHAANCPCGCLLLWPAQPASPDPQLPPGIIIERGEHTMGEAAALLAGLVGWPAEDIQGFVIITVDRDRRAGLASSLKPEQISGVLRASARIHDQMLGQGPGEPRMDPGPPRTGKDTPPC